MSIDIRLQYIENAEISEEDYLNFLESQYGSRAQSKNGERRNWYKKKEGYKILLAILDGRILGQSCAYKDNVIINGKEIDIWWGIDNFVDKEVRGKGIGKLLQKKMHDDLPNFSSAWYSPINGIIKRKCGAKELFQLSFCYYPISSYITYIVSMVAKKLFKHNVLCRISIPFMYSYMNHIVRNNSYSYKISEFDESIFKFIETSSLNSYDFYVKRDRKYLHWRYIDNPNLKYHLIEIIKKGEIEGVVVFTDVHCEGGFYVSKIMDVFRKASSSLKDKDVLYCVSEYFHDKKSKLDGLLSLTECCYFPKFVRRSTLLSTINLDSRINNPYISYSDQDMVQMY